MAEKSARILLVCKRFFLTKMRPYLAANAITIANSGLKKDRVAWRTDNAAFKKVHKPSYPTKESLAFLFQEFLKACCGYSFR
ncbi:MAG: hypothetical protein AABZ65_02760 [Candidatus Omnitrophota bacterium]